jgi:hypothetical protein
MKNSVMVLCGKNPDFINGIQAECQEFSRATLARGAGIWYGGRFGSIAEAERWQRPRQGRPAPK